MKTGALRHRVIIQQRGTAQDALGAPTDIWTDLTTVWAAVQPLQGQERQAAKAAQAETDVKITLRWRTGIDPASKRLKFGARLYDIESVLNIDERNIWMEIYCKEAA